MVVFSHRRLTNIPKMEGPQMRPFRLSVKYDSFRYILMSSATEDEGRDLISSEPLKKYYQDQTLFTN